MKVTSNEALKGKKIAVIHDWLVGMRGGESVLEAILELVPQAEIFSLICDHSQLSSGILKHPIHTSFLQRIPGIFENYRYFLPLMPKAMEAFDLSGFDFVISSSHCVAKGVRKPSGAKHVSYVHAPMRYMWDRFDDYFGPGRGNPATRSAAKILRRAFQKWDRKVSQEGRVDRLIANSKFIASQIKEHYGRDADVIYPFVETERFQGERVPQDFFLMVGAFAPNKRVDLAIEAFNRSGKKLKIVGSGQEESKLRALAAENIEFLGAVPRDEIARLYSQCKAFVFPGIEDFGITPLEAMASGAPVITYGKGGALETVTSETGVFFTPQEPEALNQALEKIEKDPESTPESACRARAREFSKERFQEEFLKVLCLL